MADTNVAVGPNHADLVERARVIFEEIANVANRADRQCFHIHGEIFCNAIGDDDSGRIEMELVGLRDVICRLGHLADFGSSELNGAVVRGEVKDWLLPPSYPESRS